MIITYGALDKQKIMQAFPLMRELEPGLELAAWVKYASSLIDGDSRLKGVFGAQRDGYVRGVFCYEVEPDIDRANMLHVRNFVVLDMVQRETIANILYQSIGDIARRNGCKLVRISLPGISYWTAQDFEKMGYLVDFCDYASEKIFNSSGKPGFAG